MPCVLNLVPFVVIINLVPCALSLVPFVIFIQHPAFRNQITDVRRQKTDVRI